MDASRHPRRHGRARSLRARLRATQGFTLVEVLVVILIVGILAAIAIPAYINQKGKGEDTVAKSAARSGEVTLETYYTDNHSYACGSDGGGGGCDTALHDVEKTLPPFGAAPGEMDVTDSGGSGPATATGYRVTVSSRPSGRKFWIEKNGDALDRGCSVPAGSSPGGCRNGSW